MSCFTAYCSQAFQQRQIQCVSGLHWSECVLAFNGTCHRAVHALGSSVAWGLAANTCSYSKIACTNCSIVCRLSMHASGAGATNSVKTGSGILFVCKCHVKCRLCRLCFCLNADAATLAGDAAIDIASSAQGRSQCA